MTEKESYLFSILVRDYAWIKKIPQAKIIEGCNLILKTYSMLEIQAKELIFILKTQIISGGEVDKLNVSTLKDLLLKIRSKEPLEVEEDKTPVISLEQLVHSMARTIRCQKSWKSGKFYDRHLVYELYSNMVGPYVHQVDFVFHPDVVQALANLSNPIYLKDTNNG
jgi:hypothetical protein